MKIETKCMSEMARILAIQLAHGHMSSDGSVSNAALYYVTYVADLLVAQGNEVPDELAVICDDVAGYLVPLAFAA